MEAWGPLAERAESVLQKGDRVAVQVRFASPRCQALAVLLLASLPVLQHALCCSKQELQWCALAACCNGAVAATTKLLLWQAQHCLPAYCPHVRCIHLPVQGRLKLNKWEDAAGTKRTAWKITANSISKVRSTYQPAAGGGGSFDEYVPSGSSASAPSPAPWDLPAAATAGGEQPWQGQQGQQVLTTEQKWMDFFEDTSSEALLLWIVLVCSTARQCVADGCVQAALLPPVRCCAAVAVALQPMPQLLACCYCTAAPALLRCLPSCAACLPALLRYMRFGPVMLPHTVLSMHDLLLRPALCASHICRVVGQPHQQDQPQGARLQEEGRPRRWAPAAAAAAAAALGIEPACSVRSHCPACCATVFAAPALLLQLSAAPLTPALLPPRCCAAPALWVNGKDTPAWVEGELARMDSGTQ